MDDRDAPLWCTLNKKTCPISVTGLRNVFNRCVEKAGIEKKVNPHSFRHDRATHLAANLTGDPYLAFAKQTGAVSLEVTKSTHKVARDLSKACVLGVQYGMGLDSLVLRIGKSTPYAKELLGHHKRVYQKYWAWCDHVLDTPLLFRRITTCFGWQMRIFGEEKTEGRTIKNFPCQATGAKILRVDCILLVKNNIKLIAPIHDAILIECDEKEADEIILQAQKLITKASSIVLGPGNSIKTEANVIKYPDRYSDPR